MDGASSMDGRNEKYIDIAEDMIGEPEDVTPR
jgi:hypothetical protein